MSWYMAGAAAVTFATSYIGGEAQAGSAIRNANSASKAEGEAIAKERLNKTISNSYNAAFSQMNLALQKRQLAQQGNQITAAGLAAKGDADVLAAATGSVGASVQAVSADIQQKVDSALDQTRDAFEMSMVNHNNELDMMVLNTDQSAPTVRKNEYVGPSQGANFGMALVQGGLQFASQYASANMKLGLGSGGGGTAGAKYSPGVSSGSGSGSIYSLSNGAAGVGLKFR
jgi:hypothetical protein